MYRFCFNNNKCTFHVEVECTKLCDHCKLQSGMKANSHFFFMLTACVPTLAVVQTRQHSVVQCGVIGGIWLE